MNQTTNVSAKFLLLSAVALLSGCTSFGSWIMTGERVNYNAALQITNDEQLLLNLVRLRYLDSTAFVEVGSITAQSSFQSGLEGGRLPNSGSSMFGITGILNYSTQMQTVARVHRQQLPVVVKQPLKPQPTALSICNTPIMMPGCGVPMSQAAPNCIRIKNWENLPPIPR